MVVVGVVFFTVVLVVAGIGLIAGDGLDVAVAVDFITAFVTPPALGEAAAVPAVFVTGAVPLAAEDAAVELPPVSAFPDEPDWNEVRLLVLPGVRVE